VTDKITKEMSSGIFFILDDPRPSHIDIHDIAHCLAKIDRFGGAGSFNYSVGLHSIIMSRIVPEEYALYGLLHDSAEAYVGDNITPMKSLIPELRAIETRILRAILEKWGLEWPMPPIMSKYDNALCLYEAKILGFKPEKWLLSDNGIEINTNMVQELGWRTVEHEFLVRFRDLIEIYP